MENNLLSLIIFAPLAGAAINWFVGRRVRDERFVGIVACGAVAVSTLVAFYLADNNSGTSGSSQFQIALQGAEIGKELTRRLVTLSCVFPQRFLQNGFQFRWNILHHAG